MTDFCMMKRDIDWDTSIKATGVVELLSWVTVGKIQCASTGTWKSAWGQRRHGCRCSWRNVTTGGYCARQRKIKSTNDD